MNSSKYSQQGMTSTKIKGNNNDENISQKDANSVNNANAVSLKGKIFHLEDESNNVAVDIQGNLTDSHLLKTERESIHGILKTKLSETKEILNSQVQSMSDAMHRYFEDQNRENQKYVQQLEYLKKEKSELNTKIISLESRLKELEDIVGLDDY
jgi:hypothetical protein